MKKVALFVAVTVATALVVSGVMFVSQMLAVNDWIDRCADENSGTYIADVKARQEYCSRTVDAVSRNL